MKKIFTSLLFIFLFICLPVLITLGDPPGPPGPGGNPVGNGGTPVGAPIDSGVFVLLALGVAYGAMKIYQIKFGKHSVAGDDKSNSVS
jgi:hypothetical protein